LVSFTAQNTSLYALLAFKISIDKSAAIFMGFAFMLFDFLLSEPSVFFPCSL
jgi:hypothetical protein